jgi:hypothetical protein
VCPFIECGVVVSIPNNKLVPSNAVEYKSGTISLKYTAASVA